MASEAPDEEGRFIAVGQSFPVILLGFWVFFLVLGRSWH
jgi:hypothetical protein